MPKPRAGGQLPGDKKEFDELVGQEEPTKDDLFPEPKPEPKPGEGTPAPEPTPKPEPGPGEGEPGPAAPEDLSAKTPEALQKQISGLITALQKERAGTKEHKDMVAKLNQTIQQQNDQIAFQQGQIAGGGGKPEDKTPPPIETLDDDEPVTGAQLKQVLGQAKADYKNDLTADKVKQMNQHWQTCKTRAQEKYSKEKMGEELCFDTVLAKCGELTKNNLALVMRIEASDDPAEAIYAVGKTHPEVLAALQKQGVKKVTDQLTTPKPKPTIAAGTPATPKLAELADKDLYSDKVSSKQLMAEAEAQDG